MANKLTVTITVDDTPEQKELLRRCLLIATEHATQAQNNSPLRNRHNPDTPRYQFAAVAGSLRLAATSLNDADPG